jgi:hypothetical protein
MRIAGTFLVGAILMLMLPFLASLGSPNLNYWTCFVTIVLAGFFMGLNNVSIF